MKNYIALTLAGALATVSLTASAEPGWRNDDDYYTTQRARVVQVEPVTRMIRVAVPRTACYQQPVRTVVHARRGDGATLVGGIVGGILGHNIGHGRGGATVAGAIVGAAVGRSMSHQRDGYYEAIAYKTHCFEHTRYQIREQLIGYDVTYRYRGTLYTTRMADRPGRFIRVNVSVTPAED